ncbi:MAG: cysteine desulfurase [Candidatus Nomurabacteria bacterium]|jgi:cysteine desulfurase|nr:cysteine desulfurase [Candidatus Nomurabacteria bacterium]
MIYLDYAAATPIDKKVLAAMQPYLADKFFNPSAAYLAAREVRADYEAARHTLAQMIGARPTEIILTAGATESINLALSCIDTGPVGKEKIITTAIEHPAVLETAKAKGAKLLPVDNRGRVSLDELKKAISDETLLVSIGYANNEIGTTQPIKEIAEIVREVREERAKRGLKTPLVFHTDASQAAGYLDLNVARLGVDMMTLNAGKCYGPKQVGLLYLRTGVELQPLIRGGGQEMNLRSGTENIAGAIGFAKALEIAEKKRKTEIERLQNLRDDLEKRLLATFARPGLAMKVNGHPKYRLPNILNFSISGLDGERAIFALDERGVCVSTGSACAANKGARSRVLTAIGLTPEQADGSIRISLGRGTTKQQIEELKPIIEQVIKNEKKLSVCLS